MEQKEPTKFDSINLPMVIKSLPIIDDLIIEGKITEESLTTIKQLNGIFPKMQVGNLTLSEVEKILLYIYEIETMPREKIWEIIKPYFGSVFARDLGSDYPKMTDVSKRMNNNQSYIPTMERLQIIAKRMLDGRTDLFKYNVELGLNQFTFSDNPIRLLLILIKIQKEMYIKRKGINPNAYFSNFKQLVETHSNLMMNVRADDKTGHDFFGSQYSQIDNNMRMYKSLMYRSFLGLPLTTEQVQHMLNITDHYKDTLKLVFIVNPNDRDIFEKQFVRNKKDVEQAVMEVQYMFSDSVNVTNAYKGIPDGKKNIIKQFGKNRIKRVFSTNATEIINRIYMPKGKDLNAIYKKGLNNTMLSEYIRSYFNMKDRLSEEAKAQNEALPNKHKLVIEYFYSILNRYV